MLAPGARRDQKLRQPVPRRRRLAWRHLPRVHWPGRDRTPRWALRRGARGGPRTPTRSWTSDASTRAGRARVSPRRADAARL